VASVVNAPEPIFCEHARVRLPGNLVGPLAGLQFAVQDVYAITGMRACYGSPAWLETHEPATHTASAVTVLLDAGATLAGVCVTDELAFSLTGENAHYGTPPNPRAIDRVPGGSSSGSAAAVATGAVDFALGTDTGGSVRVPASHTGLYGFRPTHGTIASDGVLPLAPSFDAVGWFARDAALCDAVGQVLLPPSAARQKPKCLLFWTGAEAYMEPGAWQTFREAAQRLANMLELPLHGHDLARAPEPSRWLLSYVTLQHLELVTLHGWFIEKNLHSFGSLIRGRCENALEGGPLPLTAAESQRALLQAELSGLMGDDAWLVLPSAPGAPPLRGQSDDAMNAYTALALTLTAPAGLCGLPQLSMPIAMTSGCPLGVSLVAAAGADRALLDWARHHAERLRRDR
jgi:amidase